MPGKIMPDHIPDAKKMMLKACPFCGCGDPFLSVIHEDKDVGYQYLATIRCRSCGCRITPYMNSSNEKSAREAAKIQWNRRTPELGTSVVRWVRYGDEKPQKGIQLLRWVAGCSAPWVTLGDVPDHLWRDDDYWAHLPEPPEENPEKIIDAS